MASALKPLHLLVYSCSALSTRPLNPGPDSISQLQAKQKNKQKHQKTKTLNSHSAHEHTDVTKLMIHWTKAQFKTVGRVLWLQIQKDLCETEEMPSRN